jgi:ATP-dependent exoDNAse (exonuclease V) alpha subunit
LTYRSALPIAELATIEAIQPDGSARLDNNRQIEFKASEHRHSDHGYAVTSHSSQGSTAERVLVHADTSVHPELLNSRFAYVSVSRARAPATRPRSSPTIWRNLAPTRSRCLENLRLEHQSHPSSRKLG